MPVNQIQESGIPTISAFSLGPDWLRAFLEFLSKITIKNYFLSTGKTHLVAVVSTAKESLKVTFL